MAKGMTGRFLTGAYGRSNGNAPVAGDYPHLLAQAYHEAVLATGIAYVEGGADEGWADLTVLPQTSTTIPTDSTSTFARTYKFADSLSGPAPIYLRGVPNRIAHQSYTSASRTVMMLTYAGLAAPGGPTVNLTDPDGHCSGPIYQNNTLGDIQFPDARFAFTGGDGYAGLMVPSALTKSGVTELVSPTGGFIVERTTDAQGQPTDEGFVIYRTLRNTYSYNISNLAGPVADVYAYSYASGLWSGMNHQYMWSPASASHRSGSYLNAYALNYQIDGKWFRMRSFVAVHDSEHTFGQPFELDTGGPNPYTFMPTGHRLTFPHSVASTRYWSMGLAMRWE